MNQPLRPMPMTAAQIVDLVERARAAERDAKGRGPKGRVTGIEHDRRRLRARCAARYQMLEGCSTREAARVFHVSKASVYRAWCRIREVPMPGGPVRQRWPVRHGVLEPVGYPAYRECIAWWRWLMLWRNVGALHALPSAGMAPLRDLGNIRRRAAR